LAEVAKKFKHIFQGKDDKMVAQEKQYIKTFKDVCKKK